MKKSDLTKALYAALVLASPLVVAESKYPAADFQPGVVYKDEKLIEQHSQATKQSAPQAPVAQAKSEPKAAEPVASVEAEGSEPTTTAAAPKESAVGNLPIALVVLAIGGFAFWSSKKGAPKPAEASAAPAISGSPGQTGVEKYVASLPDVVAAPETGVAKYLRGIVAQAPAVLAETGVARYLKNLPQTAPAGETGVAKYLKNVK